MKNRKIGVAVLCVIGAFLLISPFFAKDFVFFDFHMAVQDYSFSYLHEDKPRSAGTAVWFSFREAGKELQIGLDNGISDEDVTIYSLSQSGDAHAVASREDPIQPDSLGHFIATLPPTEREEKTVYESARADLGPNAFNPAPQRFNHPDIPFEPVFAERKYIMVYFQGEVITDAEITVTGWDGATKTYTTDSHGWINGLPNRDIREGFTASYSPDGSSVYKMHYALEDYPYFSAHFFAAYLPLLLIFLLAAVGMAAVGLIRDRLAKKDPAYAIYSREKAGIYPGTLNQKSGSKFLLIRWLCLFAGFFLWTFAGKLIHQGQVLNEISVPVFSCPFNLDQVAEVPCYYLSHLPALFNRFGPDFPVRNLVYAIMFIVTTLSCFVFLGRILCGFLCPAGLLQDLMDMMYGVADTASLHFATAANKIGNGLNEQLENFIKEHPDTKLVIIDTMQKIREAGGEAYSYASDYEIIGKLKRFADRHSICIVTVHHTRKQPAGDSFETISGTTGLLGCADGALLMQKKKRTALEATVDAVGRDQQDQILLLLKNNLGIEKRKWYNRNHGIHRFTEIE